MSRRATIDQRIAARNAANIRVGTSPGWADEALDIYLQGDDSISEICRAYDVKSNAFFTAIAKAALYRLLKAQHVDRLHECDDLTENL